MRFASVTSCSAVSSGTLPISLRYMRTGSKLPPSVCVARRSGARSCALLVGFGRCGTRRSRPGRLRRGRPVLARRRRARRGGVGARAAGRRPRRWSSSSSSSAISSSTLMPRDSNMSYRSRSSSVSGSRSGNAAKISPVVMKPRSRTWSSTPRHRRRRRRSRRPRRRRVGGDDRHASHDCVGVRRVSVRRPPTSGSSFASFGLSHLRHR